MDFAFPLQIVEGTFITIESEEKFMRIIFDRTAEELSGLLYLQSRKNSADKLRTFGEIKPALYAYVEDFSKKSNDILKPKSLKTDTNVNRGVDNT